jgi:hypothetical protein
MVIAAIALAPLTALGQVGVDGMYAIAFDMNALMVGAGPGLGGIDRDFTGMWCGPDGLPYTDDDVDISGSDTPLTGDIWGPLDGSAAVEAMPPNSGYGGIGIPYPDLSAVGGPDLSGVATPPVSGALGGGTLAVSGTPTMPNGFDLASSTFPKYHNYTRNNGIGDHAVQFAHNARLSDGRIAEWSVSLGTIWTHLDTSITNFDFDLTVTTDLWNGADELSMYDLVDHPQWEGDNKAGMYNNRRGNQHGHGHPKYFFDIGNTNKLDEDHRKVQFDLMNMSHTEDPPGTHQRYSRTDQAESIVPALTQPELDAIHNGTWLRGFHIPVTELPFLAAGDLGDKTWYENTFPNHGGYPTSMDLDGDGVAETPFDMATYVRDIIYGSILDTDGNILNGLDPHPNAHSPVGILGALDIFLRNDMTQLHYLQILFEQGPIAVSPTEGGGTGAQMTADLFGAETGDVYTHTDFMVTDFTVEAFQGIITSTTPSHGVGLNAVAHENFQPAQLGGQAAFDGELGHGTNSFALNPWDKLAAALFQTAGSIDGHIIQLFDAELDDRLKHVQIGGAKGNLSGAGTAADANRVWSTANGPAYAEARVRVDGTEADQELHLILERNNRPVGWAIVKDGAAPTLGIGGAVMRDIDNDATPATFDAGEKSGVEVPPYDASAQETSTTGSNGTLGATYTDYVLCLDANAKSVTLWIGDGDGTTNLVASATFTGTGIDLTEVDGMRVWIDPDPSDTEVNTAEVDQITWGYDFCPSIALLYIWGQGANPNSNEFIFPQSAAASITCIPVTFNDAVTISNVCITSTGSPAATTATLGPDPARPGLGNYCLNLDAALEQQQWTTITMDVTGGCGQVVSVCLQVAHLPADVNQDGNVGLADASAFVSEFNGAKRPCLVDSNNDGQVGLADVSDWVNNFNGNAGIGIPQGNGTFLPAKPACACP